MMMSLASSYAYGNPVYLTNLVVSSTGYQPMTASFSIAGGNNFVPYDILMSTNVAAPVASWNWLGIGYTSNNYTFYEQPADLGFYILAKPSKTMTVPWGNDIYGQCDFWSGITNAVQVTGGIEFSLALLNNGTVMGWGYNGATESDLVPTNLVGVTMIASGWQHNVALLTNGTVTAWGDDFWGEINVPAGLSNVTVISAQALHSLALTTNGTIVAWGYGLYGEASVPAGLSNVVAIAAGGEHNLAVSNGFVVAWGNKGSGQCNVPASLSNVWDVAAGWEHSVALKTDGTVVCWGDNSYGESSVPAGLSNVVAIAAGGDPETDTAYSLALKSDGTVVAWGDSDVLDPVGGLNDVIAIGAGVSHALAIRTGPPTPVITLEPSDEYQIAGGNVTFTAKGVGLYGVACQWQTNSVNIAGATNATLTLTNVQAAQLGSYDVVVSDNAGMGNIVSSNANLYFVTAPVINSQTFNSETFLTNVFVLYNSSVALNVSASAPGQFTGFPLSYQWQFNGTNISGATTSGYTFTAVNSGTYSVIVSNVVGSITAVWQVNVVYPDAVIDWGSNSNGQLNASSQLTNVISLAAGKAHGVVALDSGMVANWGSSWTGTNFISVVTPPLLTNAIAVAAGSRHDLALKADGTVIAWGLNDFGQTNVPANATNVIAISAGGQQSLALKKDGTVLQWGQTNAPVPAGLTNVTAIAAGTNFDLALLQNATVVAWGTNDYGQTNIPIGLSNVVAIAAAGAHALALEQNGTVVAWGAWTNVPAGLSNVLNVAAGENHSIALKNDGTMICWGDNTFGQTNVLGGLNNVRLIAGGGDFTLASQFSTLVQYPVDVTKDLLLIYNSNSSDSSNLCAYYLAHRPLVSNANVLSVACDVGEFTSSNNCDAQIASPVLNWLTNNPTKHPEYIILFYDIPTRLTNGYPYGAYGSISYHLHNSYPGWKPFVNNINAGTLAACEAYVDKLSNIGTNFSPSKLIISAGGYENTNYALDNVRVGSGYPISFAGSGVVVSVATNSLIASGVLPSNINYVDGVEIISNGIGYNLPHITSATNVAGYICWGQHSSLGETYGIDRTVKWTGNSSWWIIETIESFNGQQAQVSPMGSFVQWFSSNAFGGTNYSNTPVGAVSHTEEPFLGGVNDSATYFGLWAAGKNFAISAWNSRNTPYFQAVGDPLVVK